MNYVIVDLEATCWESNQTRERMEIIEIGAVLMRSSSSEPSGEFAQFVKPIAEPTLSDFCKSLTSIRQEQVDEADYFYQVFPEFVEWIGGEPFKLCSWGAYDLNQFRTDCARHKLEFPETFNAHINLKNKFTKAMNVERCGMTTALEILNIPLEGTHHRGIDDARNIAKIARVILPQIEK